MNGGAAASPPQALLAALQSLLKALSVAMLAAYFVLILMQVFYRFVINDSLFWAEELVRGLLVWGVMIGSVLVARARGHIRVEMLETMVPAAWRRAVLQLNDLLSLLFCLLLLFASIQLMDRVWYQLADAGGAQVDGLHGAGGGPGARGADHGVELEPAP